MVIDSSAIIAIILHETEGDKFVSLILEAPIRLIGAPTYLETAMVVIGRLGPTARASLDQIVASTAAEIVPFTPAHASRAVEAFLRYGKGRHPASLNFGDCCSYALAAESRLPLLFKGTDFLPDRHPISSGAVKGR